MNAKSFFPVAAAAAPAAPSILATIGPPLAAALPVLIPAALGLAAFGLLLRAAGEADEKAEREAAEAAEAERRSRVANRLPELRKIWARQDTEQEERQRREDAARKAATQTRPQTAVVTSPAPVGASMPRSDHTPPPTALRDPIARSDEAAAKSPAPGPAPAVRQLASPAQASGAVKVAAGLPAPSPAPAISAAPIPTPVSLAPKPAAPATVGALFTRKLTADKLATVFAGGPLMKSAAVAALRALGFGRSAAYAAVKESGPFGARLELLADGRLAWRGSSG